MMAVLLDALLLAFYLAFAAEAQTPPPGNTKCPDPGIPDYGYRHGNVDIPGGVISFGCDTGFELHGATVRRCSYSEELGRAGWSGVQPICDFIQCSQLPTTVRHGRVHVRQRTYRSVARFSCDTGFMLSNVKAAVVTCQANGRWSNAIPTCLAIPCGEPEKLLPKVVIRSGRTYVFGAVVKYECASQYHHLSGDSSRTCQGEGTWTGSTPSCKRITCLPELQPVKNGKWDVSHDPILDSTTLTYSCNAGYGISGSAERICYANAAWSGPAPVCTGGDAPVTDPASNDTSTDGKSTTALSSPPRSPNTTTTDVSSSSSSSSGSSSSSSGSDNSSSSDNSSDNSTGIVVTGQASSVFQRIPILVGAIASGMLLLLIGVLVLVYIKRRRRANSGAEEDKEKPVIYANRALFSPGQEQQKADPSKRFSTASSRPMLGSDSNGVHGGVSGMDDISEESSEMSSETPPLPPPPQPTELVTGDTLAESLSKLAPDSTQQATGPADTSRNSRISTLSLGVLAGQTGQGNLKTGQGNLKTPTTQTGQSNLKTPTTPTTKKTFRQSDPLPVPVMAKPNRPPAPANTAARPPLVETIEEHEPEELYDDTTIARQVRVRPHRGTMSTRPAAPLPKPQVAALPSLNPLERLHRSYQSNGDEDDSGQGGELMDERYSVLMQNGTDHSCYSEIDGDEDDNDDECHLYEPLPTGLGNRLSFSYDDVDSEDEMNRGGPSAAGTLKRRAGGSGGGGGTMRASQQWGDLHSDMAVIDGHLDRNTLQPGSSLHVPTDEYDCPADAIGKDAKRLTARSLRPPTGPKPPVLSKRPPSTSVFGSRTNTLMHTTISSSSLGSDDYHMPIDANPVSFTAVAQRYNEPYDVPLESIEFDECFERDYAVPIDTPSSSGGNSRHSSQKRKHTLKSLEG